MNLYANAFSCATKKDGSEFVIEFIQESPRFENDGAISGTNREPISSIIMTVDSAKALNELLSELLEEPTAEQLCDVSIENEDN